MTSSKLSSSNNNNNNNNCNTNTNSTTSYPTSTNRTVSGIIPLQKPTRTANISTGSSAMMVTTPGSPLKGVRDAENNEKGIDICTLCLFLGDFESGLFARGAEEILSRWLRE